MTDKDKDAEEAAVPEQDAIVVVRLEKPDGGIVWGVNQLLGSVSVDQVPTGLRLAAQLAEEQLFGRSKG